MTAPLRQLLPLSLVHLVSLFSFGGVRCTNPTASSDEVLQDKLRSTKHSAKKILIFLRSSFLLLHQKRGGLVALL